MPKISLPTEDGAPGTKLPPAPMGHLKQTFPPRPNEITILQAENGGLAGKIFSSKDGSQTYETSIGPGVRQKRVKAINFPVSDLAQLANVLCEISARKDCYATWSRPLVEEESFERAGLLSSGDKIFLPIDIDYLLDIVTLDQVLLTDLEKIGLKVVGLLPKAFHNVSFLVQASASHGLPDKGHRIRFWFILDRAIARHEVEPFLRGGVLRLESQPKTEPAHIDLSLYADGKPIFTADPEFQGMADPMSDQPRWLVVKRGNPVVHVPFDRMPEPTPPVAVNGDRSTSTPGNVSKQELERVESALCAINDVGILASGLGRRSEWFSVGVTLADAFPEEEAHRLFTIISPDLDTNKSDRNTWRDILKKANAPGRRREVNFGIIFKRANEAGWQDPHPELNPYAPKPLDEIFNLTARQRETDFPIEALPPETQNVILAIAETAQADTMLATFAVLGAANMLIHEAYDVRHPLEGRVMPTSMYMVIEAETGERKDTCDRLAQRAYSNVYPAQTTEYRKAMAQYEISLGKYKKAMDGKAKLPESSQLEIRKILRPAPGTPQQEGVLVDETPVEPVRPVSPNRTLSDFTAPGLVRALSENRPAKSIHSTEGGVIFMGVAMNKENTGPTTTMLTSLFGGDHLDRNRAGSRRSEAEDDAIFNRRLALSVSVQPVILQKLDNLSFFSEQGLFPRILFGRAKSLDGTRKYSIYEPEKVRPEIQKLEDALIPLARYILPADCLDLVKGIPRFKVLEMTQRAQESVLRHMQSSEGLIKPGGLLHDVRAYQKRYAEHITRLAANLHILEHILLGDQAPHVAVEGGAEKLPLEIDEWAVDAAATIVMHSFLETPRIMGKAKVGKKRGLAAELLKWMQEKWQGKMISLRDISRSGPYSCRLSVEQLEPILAVLTEGGSLIEHPPESEVGLGGPVKNRKTVRYSLNPVHAQDLGGDND